MRIPLLALVSLTMAFATLSLSAQPFGLTQRVTVSGVAIPLDDPAKVGGGAIQHPRAFPNLSFSSPMFLTYAPDSTNRIFVVERAGTIKVFPNVNDTPASSVTTFLNISSKVDSGGEMGLLSMAFAPDYAQSGEFYVYYNPIAGGPSPCPSGMTLCTRIARFKVSQTNGNVADAASETVVLHQNQPYSNHNGGMIAFGPDGMLYIALGDGGSGGDPHGFGQDCTEWLGSMLRINPKNSATYTVPSDNPYIGTSCAPETWAYGLRNPWRFSFDRLTGTLWAGDVGQGTREEVDIIRRGDNLGWNVYEGNYNPSGATVPNYRAPVWDYPRSTGSVVMGGYVYRGTQVPALYGKYVFGDYGSGRVWALDYNNGSPILPPAEISTAGGFVSYGEDRDGELYGIAGSAIYKFRPGSGSSATPIPTLLSTTGLFSSVATLQLKGGAIPFDVNAPLWSDNAIKSRWILLPGTQQIGFSATNEYSFPVGTAIVKHFELALSPTSNRRLETRVLFKHNQGWAGYTYKWNSTQTDADLLTDASEESYTVQDASGATRSQKWHYPSRSECLACHTTQGGSILGVRTRQLNRDYTYGSVVDNQLRSWNNIGLFSTNIGVHSSYQAYPAYNSSAAVETRARAYLAVNCAHCHVPGIPRSGDLDMRYDTAVAAMNLVGIRPTYGNLAIADPYRIKSGAKSSSVLYERMRAFDTNRMPPVGTGMLDPLGVSIIGDWIDGLAGTISPGAPQGLAVGNN